MAPKRQTAAAAKSDKSAKKSRVDTAAEAGPSTYLNLPSASAVKEHAERYALAKPYNYAAIEGLITDELLEAVVEESRTYGVRGEEGSLAGWGWEQKETDIYKIQQTPDLSSLDPAHLPAETLAALPRLTQLKEALYSPAFRQFVRSVTGCGPLSGTKTDGSVGLYTQGSHLLLHDDSISTRLVSYILYLPNSPPDCAASTVSLVPGKFTSADSFPLAASGQFRKGWTEAFGGALELYPVESGEEAGLPAPKRAHYLPAKWGQIVFFEVKPGRSYHAVEEVVVGEGRQRLGVSGWFHRPVEGEEGYEKEDEGQKKQDLSSLAQITAAPTVPFTPYTSDPPTGLKASDLTFLKKFLAPAYLTSDTLERLAGQFVEDSEIVLHNFLKPELAEKLLKETSVADEDLEGSHSVKQPELFEEDGWTISGPPSKHRYLTLSAPPSTSTTPGKKAKSPKTETQSKRKPKSTSATPTLLSIHTELFPSSAFRAWLGVVSSLVSTGYRTEARRFRPGLDYTLAHGEEKAGEARLDVSLGATWWADVEPGTEAEEALVEHGGWECYLAAPEEGEDPAVFQSRHAKGRGAAGDGQEGDESAADADAGAEADGEGAASGASKENGQAVAKGTVNGQPVELEIDPDQLSDGDFDTDEEEEDEDDGPLLTHPVSFNRLLIVLRDPGVMRFVKYLSAGAGGSRWDVVGEWEVGVLEEDEEEGEEATAA